MRFLATHTAPRAFTYNFLDEVEKIFNQERTFNTLPTNFTEEENKFLLTVDLPGVKKEDVQIDLKENVLTIAGTRKNVGEFTRSFTLPTTVDTEKVEATYEDGVLEITLPKAESAKPRKIEIAAKA